MKLTIEQMQNIIDNAPSWAVTATIKNGRLYSYGHNADVFIAGRSSDDELMLSDLRDEIGKEKAQVTHEAIEASKKQAQIVKAVYGLKAKKLSMKRFKKIKAQRAVINQQQEKITFIELQLDNKKQAIKRLHAKAKSHASEWKNGDECKFKGDTFYFIGMNPIRKSDLYGDCVIQSEGGCPVFTFVSELLRPQTAEQKEAKEREEKVNALYSVLPSELTASFEWSSHAENVINLLVDAGVKLQK